MINLDLVRSLLYIFIVITLVLSATYSIRYRRQKNPQMRGVFAAKMNISMGLMLLGIAMTQLLLFHNFYVRIIFGAILLLLGLFNIFAGLRNLTYYQRVNK